MFDFITVDEAAVKWNVTVQSVRSMCRLGKIPDAVKKGMMWFIPVGAEHPSQKDKYTFSGTKRKIFKASINLFAARSYDAITLRDIADATGIAQSAVYRHFESKAVILESIYAYFQHFFLVNRPSLEDLEPIIQHGTLTDIFNCVYYDFDPKHVEYLVDCTKIVFQRLSFDARAQEIFCTLMLRSGLEFAEQVFTRAIEAGRFPKVDAYALSMFSNMNREYMLLTLLASNADPALLEKTYRGSDILTGLLIKGLTANQGDAREEGEGKPHT